MAGGSLSGRLRRGLLNAGWSHHRDGTTQESWKSPNGEVEVSVDSPPGIDYRVVEAHDPGKHLLLRAIDGNTDAIIRGLAAFDFIPEEASNAT